MSPRVQWAAWLLLLVGLGAAALVPRPSRAGHPKLVVLLVVDQMRADFVDRFQAHYRGGLRWLVDNGARFPHAAYRHAITVTGAGHASVSTGRHPSSHGIVGNSWIEAGRGDVYCVGDDLFAPVGGPGRGVSPRSLMVRALGDILQARHPAAKVYAFSTKDRSAVLLGGREADGAYWYEAECGCLVSSTYYGDALPAWMERFNDGPPAARYAGRAWARLLPDRSVYERLARADRFEGEDARLGPAFPHRLPDDGFEQELRATPFSDEITVEAALAALRSGELGTDSAPDLLALGLSATDSVGHRYGPFSQEAMDNHLRLDLALGRLLEGIDAAVGLDSVVFALTADHGALPLVEYLQAQGSSAVRFDHRALWERARTAVDGCEAGPADETVALASGRSLYWDRDALRERGIDFDRASACMAAWLGAQPGVAAAMTSAEIEASAGNGLAGLFRNSYYGSRSPHVQLHLQAGHYPGAATGTGHGSAHEYDRAVPVMVAGAGVTPGIYEAPAGPEDIAPTLGAILGLDVPTEPGTRALREILAPAPR